ncbi:glyoxalase [Streptomyces viridochromogenes]|uniref:Glyoxalase n=1 Tax=Streptomyces viridochromogenes TaxID=1938 RepID=A0A0J7ZES0_STRVR|nr:VOC family protein [Streptomyces viridochromogenes]KMS73892.1 glyoxalase [Streptomyces viridochromogenes]KOG10964.1 glyoxalase [Streptomyces viridochromogenes]KOG26099.1 glyoxalase [Streptomyces viridochromogenes]
MTLAWEQVVVDAADAAALGRWWAEALGWVVLNDSADEFETGPEKDRLPGLIFVPVPEGKSVKNRLHLDFRPGDQAAEVARFLALGARRADVGQGDQPWVTLADPEGNEFCVLAARRR